MDFKDEQKMIQEVSRKFASKEIAPLATYEKEDSFPSKEIIKKLAELGLLGIMVPEKMGGAGSDMIAHVLVLEEIAVADVGIAISYSNLCVLANLIVKHGSDKLQEKFLSGLISGKRVGAFCFMESKAGSVSEEMETTAQLTNGEWSLNGEKVFVINGSISDFYLVFAATGENALSFFIVERDGDKTAVKKISNTLGIKSSALADIQFNNAQVPAENALGETGKAAAVLNAFFDELKIGAAAISNGVARAAMEGAIAYSKIREQFDQPICKFPAISDRIADMDTNLNASRALTYWVASLRDKNVNYKKEAAEAKLFASEMAFKVCHSGLQVYGGHGFIRDHSIEKYYRDQRILQIYAETNEINRNLISNAILGE